VKAIEVARELLKHPDADVMVPDQEDPADFTFVRHIRYYEFGDRFHIDWKRRFGKKENPSPRRAL
jgi:hypothetical protein